MKQDLKWICGLFIILAILSCVVCWTLFSIVTYAYVAIACIAGFESKNTQDTLLMCISVLPMICLCWWTILKKSTIDFIKNILFG